MARADAPLRQEAVDGGTGAATADAFYVRLHLLSEDVRFVVMTEIAALPTVGALSQKVGSNNLPEDLAEELVRQYTLEDGETEKRRGKIMFVLLNHNTQERLCRLPPHAVRAAAAGALPAE